MPINVAPSGLARDLQTRAGTGKAIDVAYPGEGH